jgi:arginase
MFLAVIENACTQTTPHQESSTCVVELQVSSRQVIQPLCGFNGMYAEELLWTQYSIQEGTIMVPGSPAGKISIIGFPIDLGADRRGVDMGPSALRIAGLEERLRSLGHDVADEGNIHIEIMESQKIVDQKMKYLDEILKTSEVLAKKVEEVLDKGNFPLCLGGDHSMALGSVAGIAAHCGKNGKELGVIWIDAHADMNTNETSPSGNIHGMPMAALVGLGHSRLTQFYGLSPKVQPKNTALIGVRSIDRLERENIISTGVRVYTMSEIDELGIHGIIHKILKKFKKTVDHIHVSFDFDSLDPAIAPGVGTPVRGGLTYREAHSLMEGLASCGCMSSLEISEVNPILDYRNQSAELAVELIASAMGHKIL